IRIARHVALDGASRAQGSAQLFHGLLQSLALIRQQEPGPLALKRLRDRIREAPAGGHAENERSLPFQKLRHETALYTRSTTPALDLSTPLMYVKGVGPARAAMLETKGLKVVEDLLTRAPFRYEDRTNVKTIRDLAPGEMATVMAEVRSKKVAGFQRRNLGLFQATFTDASRAVLTGKWFHGAYLNDVLAPGQKVALFGKVEFDTYSGHLGMMHPEFEILTDEDGDASLHTGRIVPIYEAAIKVTTRALRTLVNRILESIAPIADDPLPEHIRAELKLPDYWSAIRALHFPPHDSDLRLLNSFRSQAHFRLIFEEFF